MIQRRQIRKFADAVAQNKGYDAGNEENDNERVGKEAQEGEQAREA